MSSNAIRPRRPVNFPRQSHCSSFRSPRALAIPISPYLADRLERGSSKELDIHRCWMFRDVVVERHLESDCRLEGNVGDLCCNATTSITLAMVHVLLYLYKYKYAL